MVELEVAQINNSQIWVFYLPVIQCFIDLLYKGQILLVQVKHVNRVMDLSFSV